MVLNPFLFIQCSCLEIPGDGGAWWAAIYGVAQSRTRLKRLSSSSSSSCGAQASRCSGFFFCRPQALGWWLSIVVVPGLSCPIAGEIFLDQGLNLCPLHWQLDSLPLSHLGIPTGLFIDPYLLSASSPLLPSPFFLLSFTFSFYMFCITWKNSYFCLLSKW